MQINILSGIYADNTSDFRTSYPRNFIPVPKQQGISNGYLRPADGIVQFGVGPGFDRGGINWNGICYRAMGTKLVRVNEDGSVTTLAEIGGTDLVRFDYSFDRLSIASDGNLYYWNGISLSHVTDGDLGLVVDQMWIDGYTMTTDGANLVVTELNDPMSVNPLKYGSSEADPDKIKCILKLRGEVHAVNRYTIEVFQNIGGDFFPFQRIKGAQIARGSIGTRTAAVFLDAIAFLGGGRNEPSAVWLGVNGQSNKISTREIDTILSEYSEEDLAGVLLETRIDLGNRFLLLHLPDKTLVYDGAASAAVQEPIWFTLDSGTTTASKYRARNLVWCYGKWISGDPTSSLLGYYTHAVSSHYAQVIGWDFGTQILYNQGLGAIIYELELVGLPGNVAIGADPTIYTSYSKDGQTWSAEVPRQAGKLGETTKRLRWLQQGSMQNWRIQKFRGTSDAHMSFARLEARIEPLNA
jgi:hypothetical protein